VSWKASKKTTDAVARTIGGTTKCRDSLKLVPTLYIAFVPCIRANWTCRNESRVKECLKNVRYRRDLHDWKRKEWVDRSRKYDEEISNKEVPPENSEHSSVMRR